MIKEAVLCTLLKKFASCYFITEMWDYYPDFSTQGCDGNKKGPTKSGPSSGSNLSPYGALIIAHLRLDQVAYGARRGRFLLGLFQ